MIRILNESTQADDRYLLHLQIFFCLFSAVCSRRLQSHVSSLTPDYAHASSGATLSPSAIADSVAAVTQRSFCITSLCNYSFILLHSALLYQWLNASGCSDISSMILLFVLLMTSATPAKMSSVAMPVLRFQVSCKIQGARAKAIRG